MVSLMGQTQSAGSNVQIDGNRSVDERLLAQEHSPLRADVTDVVAVATLEPARWCPLLAVSGRSGSGG